MDKRLHGAGLHRRKADTRSKTSLSFEFLSDFVPGGLHYTLSYTVMLVPGELHYTLSYTVMTCTRSTGLHTAVYSIPVAYWRAAHRGRRGSERRWISDKREREFSLSSSSDTHTGRQAGRRHAGSKTKNPSASFCSEALIACRGAESRHSQRRQSANRRLPNPPRRCPPTRARVPAKTTSAPSHPRSRARPR